MDAPTIVQRDPEIAASILNYDILRLGDEIVRAQAGGVDRFHLDRMDGHFVPNLSIGPAVLAAVRRGTGLPLDAHLMATGPLRFPGLAIARAWTCSGSNARTFYRHFMWRPGVIRSPGLPAAPTGCAAGTTLRRYLA
jgi:hypothetical protein